MGGVGFDFGAHTLDMHIQGLGVTDIVRAPNTVDQLMAGHDTTLVLHEILQQLELLEREEHVLPAHRDLMFAHMHGDITAHQRNIIILGARRLRRRLVAAQHRTNTRQQLAERIRLGHIVVRTYFQSNNLVDFRAFRGQHDNRHAALLTNTPAQRDAIDAGKHHVKQHQVGTAARKQFQTFLTGFRGLDIIALTRQLIHQRFTVGFLILDNQNACHTAVSAPVCSTVPSCSALFARSSGCA